MQRYFDIWKHALVSRQLSMLVFLLANGLAHAAPTEVVFNLRSGTEVVNQRYAAVGDVVAIWLTGQFGRTEEEHKAASDMAEHGVETWVADFLAPYFLPLVPSSLGKIPDQDLAEWLESIRRHNPERRIVLVAAGRVSSLALRAARSWQQQYGQDNRKGVDGALLMFPLLYQELVPGQDPEYDPVVRQSNLDLVILQPKSSAGYWWRERLQQVLEEAGSHVLIQVLPGLRDGFYRRVDMNANESAAGARLGQILLDALKPLVNRK